MSSVLSCGYRNSLSSKLLLHFKGENGRTKIHDRFHEGLFHTGKTYNDDARLSLQVLNPTAGIFGNDSLESRVTLESDAKVLLFSPSSTQIYTMKAGDTAKSKQRFDIGENACLEWHPGWLVPHRLSSFKQHSAFYLHSSSSFFYKDLIAPGRHAHGESHEYNELTLSQDIYIDNTLISKDRLQLSGEAAITKIKDWDTSYLATIWAISPALAKDKQLPEKVNELTKHFEKDAYIGSTQLCENVLVTRIVCQSTSYCKKITDVVREIVSKHMQLPPLRINT